ncbi:hypothetical protein QBC38DRAFT_493170, partial [Podospora fimiseda]
MSRHDPIPPTATANDLAEIRWYSAYDQLIVEKPDFVAYYEKILCQELSDHNPKGKMKSSPIARNHGERRHQMHQLVQRALDKTKQTNNVQDGVSNAVQVTLVLAGAIDVAVRSSPQAALVWPVLLLFCSSLSTPEKRPRVTVRASSTSPKGWIGTG